MGKLPVEPWTVDKDPFLIERLWRHGVRMAQLQAQGLDPQDASDQAWYELALWDGTDEEQVVA